MTLLNPSSRWGYTTSEFDNPDLFADGPVNFEDDEIPLTLCLGFEAKDQQMQGFVSKFYCDTYGLEIYLYWDGDGTIVFRHKAEDWVLYNTDMKKDYEWEWVDEHSWVNKLPENYYE